MLDERQDQKEKCRGNKYNFCRAFVAEIQKKRGRNSQTRPEIPFSGLGFIYKGTLYKDIFDFKKDLFRNFSALLFSHLQIKIEVYLWTKPVVPCLQHHKKKVRTFLVQDSTPA